MIEYIEHKEISSTKLKKGIKSENSKISFYYKVFSFIYNSNPNEISTLPTDEITSEIIYSKCDNELFIIYILEKLNNDRIEEINNSLNTKRKELKKQNEEIDHFYFSIAVNTSSPISAEDNSSVIINSSILDYYLSLNAIIGNDANQYLIKNILSNNKIRFTPELKVLAIQTKLNNYNSYQFAIRPLDLFKLVRVMHINNPSNQDFVLYQRLVNKTKLNKIKKFITEENGSFPNAILLSTSKEDIKKITVEKTKKNDSIGAKSVLLKFKHYNFINVIDGQHRIFGYSGLEQSKSHFILVNLLEGISGEEERKLFVEVNTNATKVDSSLQWELFDPLYRESKKGTKEYRKSMISRVFKKLVTSKESALYNKLKTPSIEETNRSSMTFVAACNVLDKWNKELDYFDSEETLYNTLKSYFDFIETSFDSLWSIPKGKEGFYLQHNMGFTSLLELLKELINFSLVSKTNKRITSKNYIILLTELYTLLNDLLAYYKNNKLEVLSRFENLRGITGGNGLKEGTRTLCEFINKSNGDFNIDLVNVISIEEKGEITDLLLGGENIHVEFKSTFAYDLKKNEVLEKERNKDIVKTIAGFLNKEGGTLLVGVTEKDNGEGQLLGLKNDIDNWAKKKNIDGLSIQVRNKIINKYFKAQSALIERPIKSISQKEIAIIRVKPSNTPVYIKYDNKEYLWVREDDSTENYNEDSNKRDKYVSSHFNLGSKT